MSGLTRDEWIEKYVKGQIAENKKHGNWFTYWCGGFIILAYNAHKTDRQYDYDRHKYIVTKGQIDGTEIVAYRHEETGQVIFNANELQYAGRAVMYGNRRRTWGDQNPVQELIEKCGGIPLPFSLFTETGFDIRDFGWIVKPTSETVTENIIGSRYNDKTNKNEPYVIRTQPRHFTGACIFTIEKNYYLFDIDRQEIADHKIFNPFIVRLPSPADTIEKAYDLLMPGEVRQAITAGTDVRRQGEYFFIRVSDECPVQVELTPEETRILKYPPSRTGFNLSGDEDMVWLRDDTRPFKQGDIPPANMAGTPEYEEFQTAALRYKEVSEKARGLRAIPGELGKGTSATHKVEKFVKIGEIAYVSGKVEQSRRQHGDLILSGWYRVVPNTGVISWQITGKID